MKILNNKKNNIKCGFTLVELLVTISMFVIITGVVLINSNKFDSTVLLNNFAYDVALTIRQAQSYGVNVRENTSGSSDMFGLGYGVYFNPLQSPTNFVLFSDVDSNKKYADVTICPANDSSNLECIQKFSMTKGTLIQSMCAGTESACTPVNQLSILFQRPSLEAKIYINDDQIIKQAYAKIILAAANGATSTIVVTQIGQIYVRK